MIIEAHCICKMKIAYLPSCVYGLLGVYMNKIRLSMGKNMHSEKEFLLTKPVSPYRELPKPLPLVTRSSIRLQKQKFEAVS